MNNKEKYDVFCENTYVPIFSKAWWMDATCGTENWDVWLYESGGSVLAAMPYYFEMRGPYRYITKAKLTQNNGILFDYRNMSKLASIAEFEQKVIDAANDFIESKQLDVYEQQYHHSFKNWQPFYWHNYTCMLRYTYIIDTKDMDVVNNNISSKLRSVIRKGEKNSRIDLDVSPQRFYKEHEKVFLKQGLECPFGEQFWDRLYSECIKHNCGQIMCAVDSENNVNSVAFYVWDEKALYLLLGGSMPDFSKNDTYSFLIYSGIKLAHVKGLDFDFEGSMIKRIAQASRQFGGIPTPYYRIRKVFNPGIVRKEAEEYIVRL